MYHEIKSLLRNDTIFYSLVIVLVAVISFGLGRLSVSPAVQGGQLLALHPARSSGTPSVESVPAVTAVEATSAAVATSSGETAGGGAGEENTTVVASKSGTKYHAPWCPGAKQIKEANLISFKDAAAARASGYTPAANCPGLE